MTTLTAPPAWFTTAVADEPSTGAIEVLGATIRYRTWGEGDLPSIVLLHGGAAHARWWDHIGPHLAHGRQVIAFDFSGHGDSDQRDDYSVETWAAEALAVARLTTSARPILIGHSLGGVVAFQAATGSGSELGGIVIIDSPLVHFTPEEDAAADRLAFGPMRLSATREELVSRFRPIPDQPSLDYIARHIADVSVVEVDGGWRWKFDSKIFDRAPRLPSLGPLACRTACFRGETGMIPDEMATRIVDGLGGDVAMVEIPDAGHAMMLDQPVALITGLRSVLAGWELATPA